MKTLSMILLMTGLISHAQTPKVSRGTIVRIPSFHSAFVDSRTVDVWLPDHYSSSKKYAVLYMHDGQMLFDPKSTWNGQAWQVDSIAGRLRDENKIRDCIIVGIWNNGQKRHPEYFPQKVYPKFSVEEQRLISDDLIAKKKINGTFQPISDDYLKFIVRELKPYIDKTYSTFTDAKNTMIAGSSMGGLISLYAICEYPKVFGKAACLSTHWTGIYQNHDNPIPAQLISYLKGHLPNPKKHSIYFDYGNQTLDSLYPKWQKRVDQLMKEKGFDETNWKTIFFDGENHSEKAWRKRFDQPLEFLLPAVRKP